ncbi:MAG: hypothetical protein QM778_16795 [Myxococcales bacterium]
MHKRSPSSLSMRCFARIAIMVPWLAAACSGAEKPTQTPGTIMGDPDAGAGDGPDEDESDCPEANPFCAEDDDSENGCGNQPIDLTPAGVNIMVAVDGAASMASHWPRIQAALKDLRANHPDSQIGLQVFWGELVEDVNQGLAKSNWCGNTKNNVLEVGDHTADELAKFLGAMPPGPSYVGGLWETSPVIEPLNYYLTHASKLADPERTNYLVFITNGNDNCFGSVYARKEEKLLAYEKLAVELSKLNIRTIPIGFDASAKPGANGTWGMTNGNTDLDVLSTLLAHGGSGLTEVPKVDDPAKLIEVLAKVGEAARNCRFSIPDALDPSKNLNPFQLDFAVNGKLVTRDRLLKEGWNFVDGDTSQVEFFGKACQAVQGKAKLEARQTCADDVCGTAAVSVETKPRAVLYLLDSSASRIECVDGMLGCLVPPNVPAELYTRTSITFWEQVEHSLGQALVAPINDDIEFGLQFFPGKAASSLSCDVATSPEIQPAQGTEITMMSNMLEKLPLGRTPIVQALENVAAAPGRLADPSVQGAIVILSDGGDNCTGVPEDQIEARLRSAAGKLLAAGVKTYLVRYGSTSGKSPEQEAQLKAIVQSGGTDMSDPHDPNQPAYIDAKNDAELNAALAGIADKLANCAFSLFGLPEDADKANANIYLNGEVVPFDSTETEGWAWQDEEQTQVELFGNACNAFKTNRRTSLVVEFGCAPIVLL